MKEKSPKLKNFLQLVILLSVIGAFSIAQAQVVVKLTVNGDGDKLETSYRGCKGPIDRKGCLAVSSRDGALINFRLKNHPTCSNGGDWELHEVVLSNEEASKDADNKDEREELDDKVVKDFDADKYSGVVEPMVQGPHHIKIRNRNLKEYDIWYTVSAKCSEGDSIIYLDPRIRNDGSGT
jgi:hypothetical protein